MTRGNLSLILLPGAFIIPFVVMLIVVGMPLLLLELGLGQKLRVGAAGAWKLVRSSDQSCRTFQKRFSN